MNYEFCYCFPLNDQFLSESYAVFCVYQILILLKLYAKIWDQKVSQKVRMLFLLLDIIQEETPANSLNSKENTV